jgi:hypothetical protein
VIAVVSVRGMSLVRRVMLTASADAEPMYTALGFTRDSDPSMRLYL